MENRYCIRYFKIHTHYSEYLSHEEYVLETLKEMYQEDDDERLSIHLTYEDALKELSKYHCSYSMTQGCTKGYGDLEIEVYIISEMIEEDGEWYIDRDLDRAKFLFEE